MPYSNIKLISFDLDDTLYDNEPVIKLAEQKSQAFLQSAFEKQQQRFDYQLFLQYRHELLLSENKKGDEQTYQYENMSILRQQVLSKCCQSLSDGERIAQQAFEIFIKYRNQVVIEPEIDSMLSQLNQKYLLVSVTNGNCQAEKLSIGKLFGKNYSPEQGYRAKPHPQMLNQIFKDFDLHPSQVLHIGDQADSDGGAAQRAGCEFHLFAPFSQGAALRINCNQFVDELRRQQDKTKK